MKQPWEMSAEELAPAKPAAAAKQPWEQSADELAQKPAATPTKAPWEQGAAELAKPAASAKAPWEQSTEELAAKVPEKKEGPAAGFKITEPEIKQIADKYRVDPKILINQAPFIGSRVDTGQEQPAGEKTLDIGKRILGEVSENSLLNIPQFLYKKSLKPNEQAALDEVRDRIESRKTLSDYGISAAASIPGLFIGTGEVGKAAQAAELGAAATKGAHLAQGAAMGATYGLSTSKTGEEAKGAAVGAGIGLAGGIVLDLGASALGYGAKKGQAVAKDIINAWTDESQIKVATKINEARAPLRELDSQVAKAISTEDAPLPKYVSHAEEVPEAFKMEIGATSDNAFGRTDWSVDLYNESRLHQDTIDFAQHLNASQGIKERITSYPEAESLLKESLSTEGPAFVEKQFDQFRNVQTAFKVMAEDLDKVKTPKNSWIERAALMIFDGRPMSGVIDARNGTNLQVVLDAASQAHKAYTLEMSATVDALTAFQKSLQGQDGEKIVAAMRSQDISTLNSAEQAIARRFQELTDVGLARANALGVPIKRISQAGKELEFYVPDQILEPADAVVAMRQKVREVNQLLGIDLNNLDEAGYQAFINSKDPAVGEIVGGLSCVTKLEHPTNSLYQLQAAIKATQNAGKGSQLMDITASAAFQRQGSIPEFLLENNAVALLNNWNRDTFRYAYFREPLENLRALRSTFLATEDQNAANYTTNLLKDLTGRQRGTLGNYVRDALTNISVNAKDAIAKGNDSAMNQLVAKAPDYFINLTNQVYPNFLGWNPRSAVMHMMHPLLIGIPELGTSYGVNKYAGAYAETAKFLASGKEITLTEAMARKLSTAENPLQAGQKYSTRSLHEVLQNQGIIGEGWNSELVKTLNNSLRESGEGNKILELAGDANRKLNEVSMTLFTGGDHINRYATDAAGRAIAKDFLAHHPDAGQFFQSSMSRGYQEEIINAARAGDVDRVGDLFAQHLQNKVMFNYDRISMSEFGRYVGPGLSSFMKWPAAVAGDIYSQYALHGASTATQQLAWRYVAPVVAVGLMEHMANSVSPGLTDSVPYRVTIGKEGLTRAAPINVIKEMLEGKIAKPPVVAAATDLGIGSIEALKGDPEKLWKWVNNELYSYTPQAGLIRFLTSEVPSYLKGDQPSGTFLGKTQEALTGENTLDQFFRRNKK